MTVPPLAGYSVATDGAANANAGKATIAVRHTAITIAVLPLVNHLDFLSTFNLPVGDSVDFTYIDRD
jgi:hypothetical protein